MRYKLQPFLPSTKKCEFAEKYPGTHFCRLGHDDVRSYNAYFFGTDRFICMVAGAEAVAYLLLFLEYLAKRFFATGRNSASCERKRKFPQRQKLCGHLQSQFPV
jgi:hypothetical protein